MKFFPELPPLRGLSFTSGVRGLDRFPSVLLILAQLLMRLMGHTSMTRGSKIVRTPIVPCLSMRCSGTGVHSFAARVRF